MHWTQRPENKAKVAAMVKKAAKARHGIDMTIAEIDDTLRSGSMSLIDEHRDLIRRCDERINEIQKTIDALTVERDELMRLIDRHVPRVSDLPFHQQA
jgi:mevalonate kinase